MCGARHLCQRCLVTSSPEDSFGPEEDVSHDKRESLGAMEFWTVWHCLLCTLNQLTISHARSGSYSESPQSVLGIAVPLFMKVPKAKMNDLLSAMFNHLIEFTL